MKFKINRWFFSAGTGCSIILPTIIVGCGNNNNNNKFNREYSFKNIWNDKELSYKTLQVVKWIDGDTFSYFDIADSKKQKNDFRIAFIDTPESHIQVKDGKNSNNKGRWVDTTGEEHKYAMQATHFGEEEIPVGHRIRALVGSGQSYQRSVGHVFYGDNFEKSYEVNILKKGLALPFINKDGLYSRIHPPRNPMHFLARPAADAYNYALLNKKGLFNISLHEVLKVHGSTDLTSVEYKPQSNKSIYNYVDIDYWSKEK